MSTHSSNLARRDFIQLCAAGIACPAVGKPPARDIVVGLEFGRAKICAAVGERMPDGTIRILGIGHAVSQSVWDVGMTNASSSCLREALADAEAQSGVKIRRVMLAVSTPKIGACCFEFEWEYLRDCGGFCYADRGDGVLRQLPLVDCHRLPNGQVLSDGQILLRAGIQIENNSRCLSALGIEVERLVFAPAASAAAVLSVNQKELGALVIDMGAGRTNYAVYAGGVLVHGDCIDGGGEDILSALARDLHISKESVEKYMIEYASVRPGQNLAGGFFRLQDEDAIGFTDRIKCYLFNHLLHGYMSRRLSCVRRHLRMFREEFAALGAGVHLTGGFSLLPGIDALAQQVFGIPAQLARLHDTLDAPQDSIENPQHACAIGLTQFSTSST